MLAVGGIARGRRAFAPLLALAAALGAGCRSLPVEEAVRREAEFGEPSPVADAGGRFTASLSLPFQQSTDAEGTHEIEIPIAESVPIFCFVWPDEAWMSVTLQRTSQLIYDELRESGIEVSEQQILALHSGAIEGVAYQTLKAAFRLEAEGEQGVGLMKVSTANKHGHGIACHHWDVGYIETFDRAFEELVSSFRASDPGPEPYYTDIATMRIAELTVGVVTTTFTRDEEGDVRGRAAASMLIPRSPSELLVSYSQTTDWSTDTGELINAYETGRDGDEMHTDLALHWAAERGWHVEGTFQGVPIETDLAHEEGLSSMLTDMLVMKHALVPRGEHSSVRLARWVPDANPTAVVEVVIAVDAEDDGTVTVAYSGIEMLRAERDVDGLPRTGSITLGGATIIVERIYENGEL